MWRAGVVEKAMALAVEYERGTVGGALPKSKWNAVSVYS